MRRNNKLAGTYFCGNEASDYAKENGFLDYATLAKAFDAVLNNGIIQATSDIGYWDIENGSEEYYEDNNGNRYTYDEKEERIEELEAKIREYEDTINEVMERDEDYEENHVYIAMNENISRIDEEIKALEERIKYYTSLGCKDNQQLSSCVNYSNVMNASGFIRPITKAVVTSEYGWRLHPTLGYSRLHGGIDLGTAEGQAVYPAAAGKVTVIINKGSCGGNQVYITHNINEIYCQLHSVFRYY